MEKHWATDSIFYHIYPLGFCGAPERNNFNSAPCNRLEKIYDWIPHLRNLNVNALYLGPLFESTAHGYDTADYFHVDRRLGTNEVLASLIKELHNNGIKVILDGVFNHVERDFWAFRGGRSFYPCERDSKGWISQGQTSLGIPFAMKAGTAILILSNSTCIWMKCETIFFKLFDIGYGNSRLTACVSTLPIALIPVSCASFQRSVIRSMPISG